MGVAPRLERVHVLRAHTPIALTASHAEILQNRQTAARIGLNMAALPGLLRHLFSTAEALAYTRVAAVASPHRQARLLGHVGARRGVIGRVDAANLVHKALKVRLALLRLATVLPQPALLDGALLAHRLHMRGNLGRRIIIQIQQRRKRGEEQGVRELGADGQRLQKTVEPRNCVPKRLVLLLCRKQQGIVLLHHIRDLAVLRQKRRRAVRAVHKEEHADEPVEPVLLRLLLQALAKDLLSRLLQPLLLAQELHQRNVHLVLIQVRPANRHALLERDKDLAPLVERQLVLDRADIELELGKMLLLLLGHIRHRQVAVLSGPPPRVVVLLEEDVRHAIVYLVPPRDHMLLLVDHDRRAVEVVEQHKQAVLSVHTLILEGRRHLLIVSLELVQQQARQQAVVHHSGDKVAHILHRPGDAPLVDGVEVNAAHQCVHNVNNLKGLAHRPVGKERSARANRHLERKEKEGKRSVCVCMCVFGQLCKFTELQYQFFRNLKAKIHIIYLIPKQIQTADSFNTIL